MDTLTGGGYSLDDLRGATEKYVMKRTKTWRGACWYKPNTVLRLDWDYDEMLRQVGELLSCSNAEAECVLKLLKAAGMRFEFAVYTHEEPDVEDDEEEDEDGDDDEEFDEEGWLVGSEKKKRQRASFLWRTDIVGRNYRYLGVLSEKGLRRQKQIIFRDGYSSRRVFFPRDEIPIMAQYAAEIGERYERKKLHQVRLLLKLQIYYLVMLCDRE